jgi:hypothetical protein
VRGQQNLTLVVIRPGQKTKVANLLKQNNHHKFATFLPALHHQLTIKEHHLHAGISKTL